MASPKSSYLTILVLTLIREYTELYGAEIAKIVFERTDGKYELREGVLYPLLNSLRKTGLIHGERRPNPEGGATRVYFSLTPDGKRVLEEEQSNFEVFVNAIWPKKPKQIVPEIQKAFQFVKLFIKGEVSDA